MIEALCACFIHINGLSHHAYGDFNERNLGIGASVETFEEGKWYGTLGADVYIDSNDETAAHVIQSIMRRFGPVSVGVAGGMMHRDDMHRMTGLDAFPVVLPVASIGSDSVRVRATGMPSPLPNVPSVAAAQLQLRF